MPGPEQDKGFLQSVRLVERLVVVTMIMKTIQCLDSVFFEGAGRILGAFTAGLNLGVEHLAERLGVPSENRFKVGLVASATSSFPCGWKLCWKKSRVESQRGS